MMPGTLTVKCRVLLVLLLLCSVRTAAGGVECLLRTGRVPEDGRLVADVDFSPVLRRADAQWQGADTLSLSAEYDGEVVPVQFVPAPDFSVPAAASGTVIMRLPSSGQHAVTLQVRPSSLEERDQWTGTASTAGARLSFDGTVMGGLPYRIRFLDSGHVFEGFRWNDRLHSGERGGFLLRNDPDPVVTLLSDGPLCTVVRVRADYVGGGGDRPPGAPRAWYTWYCFADSPLIRVTAQVRQEERLHWDEVHFLEFNCPGNMLRRWAGGEPVRRGEFTGSEDSESFGGWGAVLNGPNAVAALSGGDVKIYDGRGGYGSYLHAAGTRAWQGWDDTEYRFSSWLWVGSAEETIEKVRQAKGSLPVGAEAYATAPGVRRKIEQARKRMPGSWRAHVAARMEARGMLAEAEGLAGGKVPGDWTLLWAGDLRFAVQRTDGGLEPVSLYDAGRNTELLARRPLPLFELRLRDVDGQDELTLTADRDWRSVEVSESSDGCVFRWSEPAAEAVEELTVVVRPVPNPDRNAIRWSLEVQNQSDDYSLWRVEFPQVRVARPGDSGHVFFPRGPGEVKKNAWSNRVSYSGRYPGGWCAMQYMAAYGADPDGGRSSGLYMGLEDPRASIKRLTVEGSAEQPWVTLGYGHPPPGMGQASNDFVLSGHARWQLLNGDWYDAATIYRRWVRREARWFPKDGRRQAPTPDWMKELCIWALGGGAPEDCVDGVKKFAGFMEPPVGFHWYRWHKIPFDNDYPHYFPTEDGFRDGVRELQQAGVRVMPYINGRLWDTRDRGSTDHQFSSVAQPAVTKGPDGEPHTETYGSEEEDGSPVKLGVMCPTTELWQKKVRDVVLRLQKDCGVDGVYIDQVAAASPELCFDPDHDHPPGGGHWWGEGYGEMLRAIRREMPEGAMLTTECNAEPFLKWFDGYLTWHWQHDGQVPAFPAIYGGAIQMFGRAYRGGPSRELALRMKAGQQLVFGEQLGWIGPGVVNRERSARYLRRLVRLRRRFRRYFTEGRMMRPPELQGDVPTVRADWRWHGEWPVSTDAVLAGAWAQPDKNEAVVFFVNVSRDETVEAQYECLPRRLGVDADPVRVREVNGRGDESSFTARGHFRHTLELEPGAALAWELQSGDGG